MGGRTDTGENIPGGSKVVGVGIRFRFWGKAIFPLEEKTPGLEAQVGIEKYACAAAQFEEEITTRTQPEGK